MSYAKELKLKGAYINVALLSYSAYGIKATVGIEPTEMYPIVSGVEMKAATNLSDAEFVKSQ